MSRRKATKPPPRAHAAIEPLEPRAMLAGVGPESWSAPRLAPAPLGTGALFSSGIILTCSSPTPGSSGTASPPAPAAGSGGTTSGSTGGVSTNGPALSSQYTGGSGVGKGSGTSSGSGGTTSGGDLWLAYSTGSGAGVSTSGFTGGLSTNGPALSSQYNGGSGAGKGSGTSSGSGGTTSGGELWLSYSAGSAAGGSPSGSAGGVSKDGPVLSSQYTGGSGIGRITPLFYNPKSDGPPVFDSGVWTGDDGGVQFVQTADTGNQGTDEGDGSQSDGKSRARSWWGIRGWFLGDEPTHDGGWQVVQTVDNGNQPPKPDADAASVGLFDWWRNLWRSEVKPVTPPVDQPRGADIPAVGLPDQLPALRPDGTLDPVLNNTVEEAGSPAARTGKALEGLDLIPPKGLQKIFNKHGEDLGLDGDWNKSRGLEVLRALREHLSGAETTVILGRYRGEKVVHFLDPSIGVNVVTSQDGKFIGVWALNDEQLESVRKNGRLF